VLLAVLCLVAVWHVSVIHSHFSERLNPLSKIVLVIFCFGDASALDNCFQQNMTFSFYVLLWMGMRVGVCLSP